MRDPPPPNTHVDDDTEDTITSPERNQIRSTFKACTPRYQCRTWTAPRPSIPACSDETPTIVRWTASSSGVCSTTPGFNLFHNADQAGHGAITIVTPDMTTTRRVLAERGLELGDDVHGDFGVIAQISDPDGNLLTLAEPPSDMP